MCEIKPDVTLYFCFNGIEIYCMYFIKMDKYDCTTLVYPYFARNPNKTEQYNQCFAEETS